MRFVQGLGLRAWAYSLRVRGSDFMIEGFIDCPDKRGLHTTMLVSQAPVRDLWCDLDAF